MTLTLDFESQILKKPYQSNKTVDWHGTKRMWVDKMWDPSCVNFDLTHDLDLGFFNSHILGIGRLIDFEWKRCELDTMLDAQWACSWANDRATVHG